MNTEFSLRHDSFGALVFEKGALSVTGVTPVRAFPVAAPQSGIALLSPEGHELVWIDQCDDLPEPLRQLVEDELAKREFMPEIHRLIAVSSFATPCTWHVDTDRGEFSFILRGEEDIRRLKQEVLLISDSHGIHFLIRNPAALDAHSRKLLDRFL